MTRLTSDLSAGDTGRIEQYNDMRTEAKASSYLFAFEQSTPDLTLKVSPGQIYFGSTLVEFAGGNSPSFTAPTTHPRIDILSINSSGTLVRTAGDEDASPTAPAVPAGNLPIAQIFNRVGQTSIKDEDDSSNGYIEKDLRPFIRLSEWTLLDEWTYSTDVSEVDFTDLGSNTELLVVFVGVTASEITSRLVRVSEDNGSTFLSSNKYGTGGSSFNRDRINASASSSLAMYCSVQIQNSPQDSFKTASATAFYTIDSQSPINAIKAFIAAGNMTGGSIKVYGK